MTVFPGGPQDGVKYELVAPGLGGAINYAPNPKAVAGLASWSGGSLATFTSGTLGSGGFPAPTLEMQAAGITTGAHCIGDANNDSAALFSSVTLPAGPVTVSAWVYVVAQAANPVLFQANDTVAAVGLNLPVSPQWIRYQATITEPGGRVVGLVLYQVGAGAAEWYVTGVQVEVGSSATAYFDGDRAGAAWLGASNNSASQRGQRAVFNDPADADYVGMARFTGLDGVDIREAIDERAGADGGVQGLNFRGPRAVVGTVDIVPTSTVDRNTKVTKLKRALKARTADGIMAFQPDGGAPQMQVKYRISQPHRRASDQVGWKTQYQFGLTCADPNIYSVAQRTATVSASPWQATITNQGDGDSPPVISVPVNASGDVNLTNLTTGKTVNLLNPFGQAFLGAWNMSVGSAGSNAGQFNQPYGMTVDGSGNVYVADTANNRIQVFNSSGVFQYQWGTYGSGNGQFNQPTDVAIDGAGHIWVTDWGNNRIQGFAAGSPPTYQTQFGTAGSGNGQFNGPGAIVFDGAGNIFVSDTQNNRIQKLTPGVWPAAPTYASQFGTTGTGNNNLNRPRGLVVDSGGTNVFICDSGNHRIKKVTNASPPVYVSDFGGGFGSAAGQFNYPFDITRDSSNNFYIADQSNNRIQKFNSSGTYQSQLGSYGTSGGQFAFPCGIAMLGSGTTPLWVADTQNNRIEKFDVGSMVLVVDFSVASVLVSQQNFYNVVNVPGTVWWTLAPGDNLIQVTGGTSWTINWRDAWE